MVVKIDFELFKIFKRVFVSSSIRWVALQQQNYPFYIERFTTRIKTHSILEQNYVQFLSIIIIIICFYFYLFFLQKYWSNTYCKTHIQTKKKLAIWYLIFKHDCGHAWNYASVRCQELPVNLVQLFILLYLANWYLLKLLKLNTLIFYRT